MPYGCKCVSLSITLQQRPSSTSSALQLPLAQDSWQGASLIPHLVLRQLGDCYLTVPVKQNKYILYTVHWFLDDIFRISLVDAC